MTRIWTIQPAHVWEMLRNQQLLNVQEGVKKYRGYVPPAYRWLQSQLLSRLPAYRGHLPWWAYCWKPDLRRHRYLVQQDAMQVRLELEIADEEFLQFPCWAWQRVFCEDYLAATREEYEDWTRALRFAVPDEDTWPLPEPWRYQVEASWQKLFDPNLPTLDWDETSSWSRVPCAEGVFEVLRLGDVRRVTLFKGSCSSGSRIMTAKRRRQRPNGPTREQAGI
jgi:hypothetical protein